jgi:hypothetical protein
MLFATWTVVLGCLVVNCVRKVRPADECVFLIGRDTVSISMVNRLVPDSLSRQKKIKRAALELACARLYPDSGQVKRNGSDLAIQMSRQSQEPWTPEAGMKLYAAAQIIISRAHETKSMAKACFFADSLFSTVMVVCDSTGFGEIRKKTIQFAEAAHLRKSDDPARYEQLLMVVFDLPQDLSRIVCEFVSAQETGPSQPKDMSSLVKGLVYDSASTRPKKSQVKAAASADSLSQNSQMALRLRSKSSIKDSIEKHIPEIEALYKKYLKIHETMKGTLWVTFQIDASGKVKSAKIKSSSISEKDFLNPFHDYIVQNLHFTRIPQQAGMMSVEFPFEFAPEN